VPAYPREPAKEHLQPVGNATCIRSLKSRCSERGLLLWQRRYTRFRLAKHTNFYYNQVGHVITPSEFKWEQEALDFVRENAPDSVLHAWSNFEFIDDEGRVNEVDLLVLTPAGLVLVEIKSRPGTVKGDALNRTWSDGRRQITTDNPLPLANRKAKRLSSVLRRQEALGGRGAIRAPVPWVEPLIFLSDIRQTPIIDPGTAKRVALRGRPGAADDTGLIGTLLRAEELGFSRRGPFDPAAVRAITRAIEQAGIRPPGRGRRVGDYELERLLTEGENWQDFAARHAATGVARRVRIYPYARAASPEARDHLARTARREFRVLEGVEHQGIQHGSSTTARPNSDRHSYLNMIRIRTDSTAISRKSRQHYHLRNVLRWCVNWARRWPSHMASACIIVALPLRTSRFEARRLITPASRSPIGRSPAVARVAIPGWR